MEINFIESGQVTYLFGGNILSLPKSRLALFWGIFPHEVIDSQKGTLHHWMEIPLSLFLQWGLSSELISLLLAGNVVTDQTDQLQNCDCAAFYRWHQDLESSSAEARQIVTLEVEARLRRLSLAFSSIKRPATSKNQVGKKAPGVLQKIGRMTAFIAEHYLEPLKLESVAREVNLRPDYATTLFKKVSGISIIDYVTQHRVSHAKRLLLTTDAKILDIALESGFGSASRFYEAFAQWGDQSPQQYRRLEQKALGLFSIAARPPKRST